MEIEDCLTEHRMSYISKNIDPTKLLEEHGNQTSNQCSAVPRDSP